MLIILLGIKKKKTSIDFSFTLISPLLLCKQKQKANTPLHDFFPPAEDRSEDFLLFAATDSYECHCLSHFSPQPTVTPLVPCAGLLLKTVFSIRGEEGRKYQTNSSGCIQSVMLLITNNLKNARTPICS